MTTLKQSGFALCFAATMAALMVAMPAIGKPDSRNVNANTKCDKPSCMSYIEGLQQAERANPTDAAIKLQLARAYQQESNLEQALIHFERYLDLKPNDINVALETTRLAQSSKLSKPNWPLAEKALMMVIKASPNPDPHRKDLGMLYMRMESTPKAVALYQDMLEQHPDDAELHGNMGLIYMKSKEFESAVRHLHKAAELQADNADRQNMLGLTYMKMGKHDDARMAFEKAMKLKPENIIYHFNLGEAYRLMGLKEKALAEYDSALKGKPVTADEYYNQGKVSYRMGAYEDAVRKYTVALEKFKDPAAKAQVHMAMGLAYESLNQRFMAQQSYAKFLNLMPTGESAVKVRNRMKALGRS